MTQSRTGRKVVQLGLHLLGDSAKAAVGAINIARNSQVLNNLSLRGVYSALTSAAAGDHPYMVLLNYYASVQGQKPALIQGDKRLTYKELRDDFNRLSHVLDDIGVKPGDRVILMMGNSPEWVLSAAAVGNVGAKLIPVSTALKGAALSYILEHAMPRAIITDFHCQDLVQACIQGNVALQGRTLVSGRPEQVNSPFISLLSALEGASKRALPKPLGRELFAGIVMYTSGTTGKPKGVERDDKAINLSAVNAVDGLLAAFGFRPDDICYLTTPMYHAAPLLFLANHLAMGATVVVGDSSQPADIIQGLIKHRVSNALMVPTLLARLVNHDADLTPADFPHLRAFFTTAAPLPVAVAQGIRERFGEVMHDFYGATETGIVTMAKPQDFRERPGSVGKALPGAEIYILGEDLKPVPQGQVGELFARTGLTMGGYRGDRDATRRAAWEHCFSVGDQAYQDKDGYVYIVGRSSELIITGGVNVYPAEIESILIGHEHIAEVAVVGVNDEEWGEAVHAVVVAKNTRPKEAELKAWSKDRLSKAQAPKAYHFVQSLPHSPQGKVRRRQLRADIESGQEIRIQ